MKNPQRARYTYMMLAVFGAISLSITFFFVLYRLDAVKELASELVEILYPFIYGGVLAYLLRPVCNWYEDTLNEKLPVKMKRFAGSVAVTLTMITGVLIIYTLIIMILPQLFDSIRNIWQSLPERVDRFLTWVTVTFGENEELLTFLNNTYVAIHAELETWIKETLIPQMSGIFDIVSGVGHGVARVFQFLLDFLIGWIVAVYLLTSRKKFAKQGKMIIRSMFSPKWARLILDEISYVDRMFGGFIDGKIVDSAIIGVLCYIGCIVFKFPNALLVAAIVGITNVIPFFGPFIGAIPSTILILLEEPIKGIWFVVFIFALQQLDGNVIGPKILGDKTGLSSFWVLFAIILFGGIWGLVGMVICVPLFAVIYDLIKKMVHRGLKQNDCVEVWDEYHRVYGEEDVIPAPKSLDEDKGSEITD